MSYAPSAIVLVAAIALTGCSKQEEIRSGLVDAGVAAPVADCMSREMAKRLSASELRKLSRVEGMGKGDPDQWTIADYVEAARRVGDPKVVAVTGAAAAYCSAINQQL